MNNRIRKFREKKGLSQRELAEAMGTSQQQIQRFEVGTSPVKLDLAARLCDVLGAQMEELFPAMKKSLLQLRKRKDAVGQNELEKALLEGGVEADPAVWTLKVRLRGGTYHVYRISVADKNRLNRMLADLSHDQIKGFFCFDSSDCAVAINLGLLSFCHVLFDPPGLSEVGKKAEETFERVRVWLPSSTEPECFDVEPDYPEERDENELGPFGYFLIELDSYDAELEQFVSFIDVDGETAYFRTQDIGIVEIDLTVLHPELNEEDEDLDTTGRTSATPDAKAKK